jgi:hypothetical protein
MQVMVDYRDARITCDGDGIRIGWYYFPAGSKLIRWADVRQVEEHDMGTGIGHGRWRIWGSGDLRHWFNLDGNRPKKRLAYIFHLGGWTRPVLTPDDPAAFKQALSARGHTPVPASPRYSD